MKKINLLTVFIAVFITIGSIATLQAMRVNPPENLELVMMGQIDGDLVELAIDTNDETLITQHPTNPHTSFFEIIDEGESETEENGLNVLRPFFSDTNSD